MSVVVVAVVTVVVVAVVTVVVVTVLTVVDVAVVPVVVVVVVVFDGVTAGVDTEVGSSSSRGMSVDARTQTRPYVPRLALLFSPPTIA